MVENKTGCCCQRACPVCALEFEIGKAPVDDAGRGAKVAMSLGSPNHNMRWRSHVSIESIQKGYNVFSEAEDLRD